MTLVGLGSTVSHSNSTGLDGIALKKKKKKHSATAHDSNVSSLVLKALAYTVWRILQRLVRHWRAT